MCSFFPVSRMLFDPDENPFTACKHTGTKLVHWLPPIPMEPMKRVRKAFGGVTINDILSTAVGRAVWRYLLTKNTEESLKSSKLNQSSIPENWTLSELQGVSLWTSIPKKFGNKLGGCRIFNSKPAQLDDPQRESGAWVSKDELRKSVIEDLLAKRRDIYFHVKKLKLPAVVQLACRMLPNNVPSSLANLLMPPPSSLSYLLTNIRSMPVTMTCMGCPLTLIVPFPQLFGKSGKLQFVHFEFIHADLK